MRNVLFVVTRIGSFALLFGLIMAAPVVFYFSKISNESGEADLTPITRLPLEAIAGLSALLTVYVLGRWLKRPRFEDLGLTNSAWLTHLALGGIIGGAALCFALLSVFAIGALSRNAEAVLLSPSAQGLVAGGMIFNTLFQEVTFRGYILPALMEKYSQTAAVVVSSLLFAGIHAGVFAEPFPVNVIGFTHLTLAGVLTAIAYLRTRSLWLPIGIHFGWNFLVALFGFSLSGQQLSEADALFHISGNALLSGGDFGIEGGLFGLFGPLAGIALVLLFSKGIR